MRFTSSSEAETSREFPVREHKREHLGTELHINPRGTKVHPVPRSCSKSLPSREEQSSSATKMVPYILSSGLLGLICLMPRFHDIILTLSSFFHPTQMGTSLLFARTHPEAWRGCGAVAPWCFGLRRASSFWSGWWLGERDKAPNASICMRYSRLQDVIRQVKGRYQKSMV